MDSLHSLLVSEGLIRAKTAGRAKSLDQHLSEWLLAIYDNVKVTAGYQDWVGPTRPKIEVRSLSFTLNVRDVMSETAPGPVMTDVGVDVSLVLESLSVLRADFKVFADNSTMSKSRTDLPAHRSPNDLGFDILEEAGKVFERAF